MTEKLINAEAILKQLIKHKNMPGYKPRKGLSHEVLNELIDRIERDLDEMIDDMYREQQERNRQIEMRLDDAYGNADRLGDVLAGGSF